MFICHTFGFLGFGWISSGQLEPSREVRVAQSSVASAMAGAAVVAAVQHPYRQNNSSMACTSCAFLLLVPAAALHRGRAGRWKCWR